MFNCTSIDAGSPPRVGPLKSLLAAASSSLCSILGLSGSPRALRIWCYLRARPSYVYFAAHASNCFAMCACMQEFLLHSFSLSQKTTAAAAALSGSFLLLHLLFFFNSFVARTIISPSSSPVSDRISISLLTSCEWVGIPPITCLPFQILYYDIEKFPHLCLLVPNSRLACF